MTNEECHNHREDKIVQAIVTGGRAREMLRQLPTNKQYSLAKLSRVSIPENKKNSLQALTAAEPKILETQKKFRYKYLIDLWDDNKQFNPLSFLEAEKIDWVDALTCVLKIKSLCNIEFPEFLENNLIDVIEGKKTFLNGEVLNKIKHFIIGAFFCKLRELIMNAGIDFSKSITRITNSYKSNENPSDEPLDGYIEDWNNGYKAFLDIQNSYESYAKRMMSLAEEINSLTDSLSDESQQALSFPEDDEDILRLIHSDEFVETLREQSELLQIIEDADPERKLAELLTCLPERLQNIPLDRDRRDLLDEATRLSEALQNGTNIVVADNAPMLHALWKILIVGDSFDDSIRDSLDMLSGKFLKSLDNGVITVSELTENEQAIEIDIDDTEEEPYISQQEPIMDTETVSSYQTEIIEATTSLDAGSAKTKLNSEEHTSVSSATTSEDEPTESTEHDNFPIENSIAEVNIKRFNNSSDIDESDQKKIQSEHAPKEENSATHILNTAEVLPTDADAHDIAKAIADQKSYNNVRMLEALQAELLIESEYDWFFLLSNTIGYDGPCSPWIAEVIELGTQYQPRFNRAEMRLKELFEHLEEVNVAWAMALLAGTIRPCLMIPHVYPQNAVSAAAKKLEDFLPASSSFARELINYANRGTPLAEDYIRGLSTVSSWEEKKQHQIKQLTDWLDEAPHRKTKYQPATRVWATLSGPNGQLARLVIQSLDGSNLVKTRELAELWKDSDYIERILAEASENALGIKKNKSIRYGARETLDRYINEALDKVNELLALHEHSTELTADNIEFISKSFAKLQEQARTFKESIKNYSLPEESPAHRAGAKILEQSLQEIISNFTSINIKKSSIDPVAKRYQLRLRIPWWPGLDIQHPQGAEAVPAIVKWLSSPLDDIAAFYEQLKEGNVECARAIFEDIIREHPEKEDELQAVLKEKSNEWRRRADDNIEVLLDAIQDAYLRGALGEQDQNNFSDRCERLRRRLQGELSKATEIISDVDKIHTEINIKSSEKQIFLKQDVNRILQLANIKGVEVPETIEARIHQGLIDKNFSLVMVFSEMIEKSIQEGTHVIDVSPSEDVQAEYYARFKSCVNTLCHQASNFQGILQDARQGKIPVLPELNALEESDLAQRIDALGWWNTLLNGRTKDWVKQHSKVNIFQLLRWLGFQVERQERLQVIKDYGPPNYWKHYEFVGTIDSPLPRFGSLSRGKQQLIFVWGNLEPSQIAQWLMTNINDRNIPITIFCFKPLTFEERTRAMMACRTEGMSPLIIDSAIITWLCAYPPQVRTIAMFHAAMAGSHDNPYTPMGGSVPPEMFFGREEDIHNLWRIDGPCIIYGGRQLGKSALLKEVHRRYHDPANMNFVFYEGVQPDSDLWKVFRRRLQREDMLPSRGVLTPQTTRESIKKLLKENERMRILFLLDECDFLLEQDSKQDFEQIKRLRDLMNETDRRFKAIFTGLHSVQRFQRIPNQPLAHFGSPLRIGPLGAKDAIALIEKPLSVLGYKFAPEQLVHQVLAQTNYHPSLIQLFCHELVNSMLSAVQIKENYPPFKIKGTTISQVWRRTSLSQQMRDRFDWTLNLDKRYRAIGYTVAWLEAASDAEESGFPVNDLLDSVKENWPAGFMSISMDEFIGLLDEMEGLGVLAKDDTRRYRLRNANVLQLMGGERGIEEELAGFINMPPEEGINPQVMRRIIDRHKGLASPLTLQQEGALLADSQHIHILIGSEALGLSSVQSALQKLLKDNDQLFQICPLSALKSSPEHLMTWVKDTYRNHQKPDYITLFVPLSNINSDKIIKYINNLSQWITSIRSEKKMARVVVLIDAETYILLSRNTENNLKTENAKFFMHYMQPWKTSGLEQWFHDMERPGTNAIDLITKTGGWHILLQPMLTKLLSGTSDASLNDLNGNGLEKLISASGIMSDTLVRQVFSALSDLEGEEVQEEELVLLLKEDGLSGDEVRATTRLLIELGLIRGGRRGLYAEPILASAARMASESPASE